MTTYIPREGHVKQKWLVLDAENQVLGRVATVAASLLRGKHKPQFTPYLECGDHVIIINAAKARVTGAKVTDKKYYRHSGYPGGIKETSYGEMMAKHPTRAMYMAVKGMLPHNRLGRKLATHLRVYADDKHEQTAQVPVSYPVSMIAPSAKTKA